MTLTAQQQADRQTLLDMGYKTFQVDSLDPSEYADVIVWAQEEDNDEG